MISKGGDTSIWIVETYLVLKYVYLNFEINVLDYYSVMSNFCIVHYIEMHKKQI